MKFLEVFWNSRTRCESRFWVQKPCQNIASFFKQELMKLLHFFPWNSLNFFEIHLLDVKFDAEFKNQVRLLLAFLDKKLWSFTLFSMKFSEFFWNSRTRCEIRCWVHKPGQNIASFLNKKLWSVSFFPWNSRIFLKFTY